jgi:hypothetical protein
MQVVGKAPTQTTGWPPNQITDPTIIMPTGKPAAGTTTTSTA